MRNQILFKLWHAILLAPLILSTESISSQNNYKVVTKKDTIDFGSSFSCKIVFSKKYMKDNKVDTVKFFDTPLRRKGNSFFVDYIPILPLDNNIKFEVLYRDKRQPLTIDYKFFVKPPGYK